VQTEAARTESVEGNLDHLLEEQITEALQPVLLKIRREVGESAAVAAQQTGRRMAVEPGLEVERVPVPRTGEAAGHPVPVEAPGSTGDGGPEPESDSLGPAFSALVHALAERAEHGLGSLFGMALERALASAVRGAVRQHADEALGTLVDEAFAAAPDDVATEELRAQTTEALQGVLDDMIDSIFAGPIRADLMRHGERVIEALVQRDPAKARLQVELGLRESLHDALELLQPHWSRIIRLVLPIILKTVGSVMASKVKESAQEALAGSGTEERTDEQREAPRERAKKRDTDLADLFSETSTSLRRQIEAEVESVNERLKQGLESAAKDGMRNTRIGRHPTPGGLGHRGGMGSPPSRSSPRKRSPAGRHPSAR
jgi:hypothetical protein